MTLTWLFAKLHVNMMSSAVLNLGGMINWDESNQGQPLSISIIVGLNATVNIVTMTTLSGNHRLLLIICQVRKFMVNTV